MKCQILSLLTVLFFTTTLCACAAESNDKPVQSVPITKEPVAPVEAVTPVQTNAQAAVALVKAVPSVEIAPAKSHNEPVESVSSAQQILSFARAQLPQQPIRMNGALKERAPNGFVKRELTIEMDLNWGADPANATYRIRDEKSGLFQTLEIQWLAGGPIFNYSENNKDVADFDPNKEIAGLGVTWADLSFSFLWTKQAETLKADKKLGKECHVISVPRGQNHLLLWIEQETGRVFGAKEETPGGKMVKEIKVVSVKEFDKLWMVKDLDIIRPLENGRTTLRIDNVEAINLQ
jgi:hypothetical protein